MAGWLDDCVSILGSFWDPFWGPFWGHFGVGLGARKSMFWEAQLLRPGSPKSVHLCSEIILFETADTLRKLRLWGGPLSLGSRKLEQQPCKAPTAQVPVNTHRGRKARWRIDAAIREVSSIETDKIDLQAQYDHY